MRTRNISFMKLGCHALIMIRLIEQFFSKRTVNCSIRLKYHNLPISGGNAIEEG